MKFSRSNRRLETLQPTIDRVHQELGVVATSNSGSIIAHVEDWHRYAGLANDGAIDVYMDIIDEGSAVLVDCPSGDYPDNIREPYLLLGLLRDERARLTIPSSINGEASKQVSVVLRSSPDQINDAQRVAGRTPGIDSFELVRDEKLGGIPAAQYVSGFANMRPYVAALNEYRLSIHDSDPSDHVQSWVVTPPEICRTIANTATGVMEIKGDRKLKHQMQVDLTDAIDSLSKYTKPFLGKVYSAAYDQQSAQLSRDTLAKILKQPQDYFSHKEIAFDQSSLRILTTMGIIPTNASNAERKTALYTVTDRYIGFTAQLLLALQEEQAS